MLRMTSAFLAQRRIRLIQRLAIHVEDSLVKLLLSRSLLRLVNLLTVCVNILESELALFELLTLASVE